MSIISKPENIKNILVIQLGPFGDVLLSTSYFEALKKKFINAKITYLTKKKYSIIVKNHPFIDNFILFDKSKGLPYFFERLKKIIEIREKKFDIIIDQQNKISTKQIVFFSGAKFRIGYKNSKWDFVYNVKSLRGEIRYSASRKFDIVAPLGIKLENYCLYYTVNKESRNYIDSWMEKKLLKEKKILVISPGSPVKKKKWDIRNYAKVADLAFREMGLFTIWLWGPGEEEDVKRGCKLMQESSIIALKTSLNQAAALLEKADIFICNDGGINHLAATVKVKTIAIFGATDPRVWSPQSDFSTHFHMYNQKVDCNNNSNFGISPESVILKIKEIF